jgi:hypothetical protein
MMDNTNQYDMCLECDGGTPLRDEIAGMLGNTTLIEQTGSRYTKQLMKQALRHSISKLNNSS